MTPGLFHGRVRGGSKPPRFGISNGVRAYEAGQVQDGPHWHVSPHVQPARRLAAAARQPHPQAGPAQDPHEPAFVVFVI